MNLQRILNEQCFDSQLGQILLIYGPHLRLAQSTRRSGKQLTGFFVALQLPLVPGRSHYGIFTSVRLAVGTAVSYIHVPDKDGYMVDPFKVVHSVRVSDITFPTKEVECGGMNFHQFLFGYSGHTGHALPHLVKQSAIEDANGSYSGIGRNLQGLQAATGHSADRNAVDINSVVKRAGLIAVLCHGPIYGIQKLRRSRSGTMNFLTLLGHGPNGNYQEAMRSHLRQKIHMLPGRIGTSAVAPGNNGQQVILAERLKIFGTKNSMGV